MNRINIRVKTLATVSLLLVILAFGIVFKSHSLLESEKLKTSKTIKNLQELKWEYVEGVIYENMNKAQIVADHTAKEIRKKLVARYEKEENLEEDMENRNPNSKFMTTLVESTEDVYLNVDNGDNDPAIALPSGIISDLSINSSTEYGENRDWESEIKRHENPYLVRKAIENIISESSEDITFWEYQSSEVKDHIMLKDMEVSGLKRVYLQEGLEGLASYEFVRFSFIDSGVDLFGVPDVNANGHRLENKKIIIIQGFDIVDAIQSSTRHIGALSFIDERIKEVKEDYVKFAKKEILSTVLQFLLVISVFVAVTNIQNYLVKQYRFIKATNGKKE